MGYSELPIGKECDSMTQIDPSMGPVEAIAPTTLWNTSLARPERKVGLVPTLKNMLSMGPSTALVISCMSKEPRPSGRGILASLRYSAKENKSPQVVEFAKKNKVQIVDLKFVDLLDTWQHFSIDVEILTEPRI